MFFDSRCIMHITYDTQWDETGCEINDWYRNKWRDPERSSRDPIL